MSGVNIPSYVADADGVKWTASWDDNGHITYKGVDKDGKEVSSVAPSDIIKAAHDYGADFGDKDGKTKTAGDFKDSCDGLVIETNKDGTLKSTNIAEANWTPRQREFVEKCLKAAAMSGKSDNKQEHGAKDVSSATSGGKRSLKAELKASFKQIAKGNAEAVEIMKEPTRLAKDVYKFGKLIAQGKVEEALGKRALKVHDYLLETGVVPKSIQERINDAKKRIEERLEIENREKKPSASSRLIGKNGGSVKNLSGPYRRAEREISNR